MIKTILREYGLPWAFYRFLYEVKLKMMRLIPVTESLFEKEIKINRIDIFEVNEKKLENFLEQLSFRDKENIIKAADDAIKGKIIGFSSIELNYGNPINWHLNPITNVEIDKSIKWYMIPDFDPDRGDIKIIWEASRFTHFFYFTRAYMLTKDIKYYEAFSEQLVSWLKKNPYSYGPNYKCGQEATLRMINVLITYSIFKSYGLIQELDEINIKQLVQDSYKKVMSNFFYAHKCIKNNHTLSEISGLIIGAYCSENMNALKKAYRLMDKEIEHQFLSDGGYIQYSFNYQRFALQIMEFVLKISSKTVIELSDYSKDLIIKSVMFMYQLQDDAGDVPNYGSNDGALIFPVTSCGYRDFRPILNTVYAIIKGVRLYETGIYDEELLWFSDLEEHDKIAISNIEKRTISFKKSGIYSFRHKEGFLMVILQDLKTRPSQMDQLHIDLWHKGINILCDSGTYSYAMNLGRKMSLTRAHNTVKVSNIEQMSKKGKFFIYNWTQAKDIEFSTNHFKGTMVSKNGYSHTREIVKIKDGYVIKDSIQGKEEDYKILFRTPCEVKVKEYGVDLIDNCKSVAKMEIGDEFKIIKCSRSLYYLKKEEITCIIIKKTANSMIKIKLL